MKNYYQNKSIFFRVYFLLHLFTFAILINKNIFAVDRNSYITIKQSTVVDSTCSNKCDEKSYTAERKICWSYWNNPQTSCVSWRDMPTSQYSLIYSVTIHDSWGYVAYDGICTYAGGKKENLWGHGETTTINGREFRGRWGVDEHDTYVSYATLDSWANEYIRNRCNEFFNKGSTRAVIESCKERCKSNSLKLYFGEKEITTVGEFLDSIPVTELIKVYDPNIVHEYGD